MSKSNSFTTLIDVRVTNDPETRKAGERDLLSFTVADNSGNDKAPTKFIRATVSGKLAEILADLKKGDRVNVVGKETFNTYNKKDGTTGVGFQIDYPMSVTRVFVGESAASTSDVSKASASAAVEPAKRGPGRPPKTVKVMPWETDDSAD